MKDIDVWLDNSEALAIDLETRLTAVPALSPDSGGSGELEKCLVLEEWLKNHGINALERHDAPDARASGGIRPNLLATIPGVNDQKRLWIMSHLDVVPPGEASHWEADPWKLIVRDGKLIGRGVEDNQQGLSSSILAALSLAAAGKKPAHTVKLLFVADEEQGSEYGIQWLLAERDLFRPDDMVLIPDGGDERGETIEVAEKNLLWLRIITVGKQCHGSRPDQGSNAHLAAAELAVRVHDELPLAFPDHDPLFDPAWSTFEPTKKESNVPNINTIPGEDVFYLDMRVLPRYPLDRILTEIDTLIREIERKRKVSIRRETLQRVESKATSPDAPLIRGLSAAISEVYKVQTRPIGIGGGTVGAYLRNRGIDAAVWSRLAESAHQPNEFALIANIIGDAKVMARLMLSGF